MNVMKNVIGTLMLVALPVIAQNANAQNFNGNRLVNPAYTAPGGFAQRGGSYWVERDPRYLSALPPKQSAGFGNTATTAFRPPYVPASYGGAGCPNGGAGYGGGSVYRWQSPSPGGYGPASYATQANSAFLQSRVPEGYYRGDGLFGADTVFAENQPVRNFFRYILP